MLQTFLPLFLMTFGICLFIVLMQFLWRYIDDMVGKGLGIPVLAEMFMYAALFLVPMALPLAILLASLMTFGVCRGIIDTYHASFDRNATICERGSLFLPKQRNARCPSQAIYIIIFHAPEITGIGYSGRFILQRYSRIQCICEEKGPEGRFIKRRDDL